MITHGNHVHTPAMMAEGDDRKGHASEASVIISQAAWMSSGKLSATGCGGIAGMALPSAFGADVCGLGESSHQNGPSF